MEQQVGVFQFLAEFRLHPAGRGEADLHTVGVGVFHGLFEYGPDLVIAELKIFGSLLCGFFFHFIRELVSSVSIT